MKKAVLVIVGPTASGKTGLAIDVAQQRSGAVISADSRQVYTDFNIGTAKPKEAWRDEPHAVDEPEIVQEVPHYLLNILSPTSHYSLAQWKKDAEQVIDEVSREGKQLIIVGGTMLYIDALVKNYEIPGVPPNHDLRKQRERQKLEDLYQELIAQDPEAAEFVESHNWQRIVRALEVIEATGKKFSELRRAQVPKHDYKVIGLFPGWEVLKDKITQRAQEMLDMGLAEEKKKLEEQYGADLPLLKTINYAQAPDLEKMIQANMRYAHRQMSWWRRDKDIQWFATVEKAKALLA